MPRLVLLSCLLCLAAACGRSPAPAPPKLVVLGFDGLDPRLTERWIRDGRLPHLAGLAGRGGLHRLEAAPAPDSAAAWASFATGTNPGKHNIYGLLGRDPRSYAPELTLLRRDPSRYLFDYLPIAHTRLASTRGGTSFWVTAGRAGVRSSILTVPVTFPPEEVPNGELLAGLPTPDMRGTMGTFAYFATDVGGDEEGPTAFGGIQRRLTFTQRVAHTELAGPPDPIVRQERHAILESAQSDADKQAALAALAPREDLRVPLTITWNHEARTANIDIQGQTVHLAEREWSRWVDLEFRANLLVRRRGMAQLFLIDAGTELRLYVSPIQWHPAAPPAPLSSPDGFAAELFERLGPYRTLGWPGTAWPLLENRIDEQAFLDDLDKAFDDRAQVILSRIDAGRWDLLVGVVDATDRVQHMLWRLIDPAHPLYDAALARAHGDAILRMYQRADRFVGDVLERLPADATLLIVSDHGFRSFRWAVNLNTWLARHGYLTLREPQMEPPGRDAALGGGAAWANVDWSRTQAYAAGLGQIYVNLAGREGQGIVAPGAEYEALLDRLAGELRGFTDPRTNAPVVRTVHRGAALYPGPYAGNAPDLQVGLADGYRTSWATAFGGVPAELVEPNLRKWSGDHDSTDPGASPGVLIASRPIAAAAPRIIDIAPTVLRYFGVAVPAELDGTALF